jgi:hypothetical protein
MVETLTKRPGNHLSPAVNAYGSRNQKPPETNCGPLQTPPAGKIPDKLALVEESIVEIEGPPQSCDLTRWGQFTDIKGMKKEMFQRLGRNFEDWLNP